MCTATLSFGFIRLLMKHGFLLAETMCFTLAARVMLFVFPLRICCQWIHSGKSEGITHPGQAMLVSKALMHSRWLAGSRHVCMIQSVAGRWMLRRRGVSSSFFIGIRRENNHLISHAWLISGDREVIPRGNEFVIILAC